MYGWCSYQPAATDFGVFGHGVTCNRPISGATSQEDTAPRSKASDIELRVPKLLEWMLLFKVCQQTPSAVQNGSGTLKHSLSRYVHIIDICRDVFITYIYVCMYI